MFQHVFQPSYHQRFYLVSLMERMRLRSLRRRRRRWASARRSHQRAPRTNRIEVGSIVVAARKRHQQTSDRSNTFKSRTAISLEVLHIKIFL